MAAEAHAPTASEYIVHHLQHLQNVNQTKIVDFTVINYDSIIVGLVLVDMAPITIGMNAGFIAAIAGAVSLVAQGGTLVHHEAVGFLDAAKTKPMPVEQVVKSVCNYKQAYTQYGGLRPFGTAFLFAGWDVNFGFQLYQTDPSGNYSGWKATVIGKLDC